MRKVSRSALVSYSAEQMFGLVDDVERYPEFLPWCSDAELHFHENNELEASLELEKGGLRHRFRTHNKNVPGKSIEIRLVDGPFKTMRGNWAFDDLDGGSRVSLDMEFEFKNRLTDKLLGPFFEDICNKLVNAFIQRADALYGD